MIPKTKILILPLNRPLDLPLFGSATLIRESVSQASLCVCLCSRCVCVRERVWTAQKTGCAALPLNEKKMHFRLLMRSPLYG